MHLSFSSNRFLAKASGVIFYFLGLTMNGLAADATTEPVGLIGQDRYYTPVNQILSPVGIQVPLPGLRPQALALSPDGKRLVTTGKTPELIVVNPETGDVLQRVPLLSEKKNEPPAEAISARILNPGKEGQVSFTGLVFSPDGSRLYLANVKGNINVFDVAKDGTLYARFSIKLPPFRAGKRSNDIPSGLAVSPDGKLLYVVLNLSNRLVELDAATGRVLRMWNVGVAPYDVVLAGHKAYVSNWGGRRPDTNSVTSTAGCNIRVRVDPVRYIANEGSVSVITLDGDTKSAAYPEREKPADDGSTPLSAHEILTGLHASGLAVSPNGRHVVVANAAGDTLSVIDTRSDRVVETIWARQTPADLFGASPNALVFDKSGKILFVCNGTQNVVAVVKFKPGESQLLGLIPVGWFPGAIVHDVRRQSLYVANIKGTGDTKKISGGMGFNSHQYHGTLSLLRIPSTRELAAYTSVALNNLRYNLLQEAKLPPRQNQPPCPVPERVGEPSVFQHVVYIIKENRTYDQVFGDIPEGNGNPSFCIFGQHISPNHHKLAGEFVLLDNTYCSGILSADGHQWTDTAFATDYMEKSFADFPRSYPDGMTDKDIDALAYSPAGFIWDNAIAHGRTLRVYGEFAITRKAWRDAGRKGKPNFIDHYREFIDGTNAITLYSDPAIESLRPYLCTNTVGWDLAVPDVFRAAQFIKELKQFEKTGNFPNLAIICLPNDHTSGTKAGLPTPAAQVADNDLALGQIVEAVSKSRFWEETCIFVIEDDPQSGWDHVSGYRTVAFVISPYTKRGKVISTQYNQTSILRTLELILGLPPMNQMDATATPMFDCFTAKPDFTSYAVLTNNIPLDQLNPEPGKISNAILRRDSYASTRLPLDKVDQCPEKLFNHILWRAMKGTEAPYPDRQ